VAATSPAAFGETGGATVTVTLKSATGALLAGKDVSLESTQSLGPLAPGQTLSARTGSDGVAKITVFSNRAETTKIVATDETDRLTLAPVTVQFVDPDMVDTAEVTVRVDKSIVPANGLSVATVSVTLHVVPAGTCRIDVLEQVGGGVAPDDDLSAALLEALLDQTVPPRGSVRERLLGGVEEP